MTEKQRNEQSVKILNKVLDSCVWINIHTLNPKSVQIILEVREGTKGYGGRWCLTISGGEICEFRGLVEP